MVGAVKRQLGIPPASRLRTLLETVVSATNTTTTAKNSGTALATATPSVSGPELALVLMLTSSPLVCETRACAVQQWRAMGLNRTMTRASGPTTETRASGWMARAAHAVVEGALMAGPLEGVSTGTRASAETRASGGVGGSSLRRQAAQTAMVVLSTAGGRAGRECMVEWVKPLLLSRLAGQEQGKDATITTTTSTTATSTNTSSSSSSSSSRASASASSSSSASALAPDSVLTVSPEDVDKYLDPLGALAAASASSELSEADLRITNADRAGERASERHTHHTHITQQPLVPQPHPPLPSY